MKPAFQRAPGAGGPAEAPVERAKILVVDDLEENLVALEALLRGDAVELLLARSGAAALELLLVHEVALALIDVQMPEMDGIELAELMRGSERTRHVPIVLVTAGSQSPQRVFKGYESGAVDFLFKPVEPRILSSKVATFLEMYRQKRRLAEVALAERRAREQLERLQQVTAQFGRLLTPGDVADTGLSLGVQAVGAEAAALLVLDAEGRELELIGSVGLEPAARERFARVPVSDATGGGAAVRLRQPVFVESLEELRRRFPGMAARLDSHGTRAIFPLLAGDAVLGVLVFAFEQWGPVPPGERAFLSALAGVCGQALERARLYAAARESQCRLEGIVSSAMDAIVTVDAEQRIVLFNSAAEAMFRCSAAEALGASFQQFVPPGLRAQADAQARAVLEHPESWPSFARPARVAALRAGGEEFPVEATLSRAEVLGQPLFTLIVRDVSERQRAEEERERLHREAHEALRAREEFISIASHDLRAPLTAVQLSLDRILREVHKAEPKNFTPAWIAERAERARSSLERTRQLMDDLLEQARSGGAEFELHRSEVDLQAVVQEHLARTREQLEHAGCTVTFRSPGPITGRWDRMRLDQVVGNLLSNAMKYGKCAPIEVELSVDGLAAHLALRDHGIGIAPEDQERIFEKYIRASEEGAGRSYGLGLWIVSRIVKAHGGTIRVESRVGEGAAFHIRLPRIGPEAAADAEA